MKIKGDILFKVFPVRASQRENVDAHVTVLNLINKFPIIFLFIQMPQYFNFLGTQT